MDAIIFGRVCRLISTGAKIHSAVETNVSTMEALAEYLDTVDGADAEYERALRRRSDFVVERLSDMIENEVDIERAKLLQKHWMEVVKSQAREKYGERKSVDLTMGQHERDLELIEKIEQAKRIQVLSHATEALEVVHE